MYFQKQNPAPGTALTTRSSSLAVDATKPAADKSHEEDGRSKNTSSSIPKLFEPLSIRGCTVKNRLWVSPMCMYSADSGHATDFHFLHYNQFAMRGAGLVMVEATAVLEDGRISPHCLGLWKGEQISGLKRIVDHMHQYGTVAGIQLSHSGRLGSSIPLDQYKEGASCRSNHDAGGWPDRVYGPSAVPFSDQFWNPKELSLEQIEEIQKAFVDAAIRADKAGFDVVDIHAAYGFLLNQFLSPLSNRRTDQYGGSFSNRIRMLVETVRQVRQVWPAEKPLFVSISAVEGAPGGWTFDETASLANILAGEGVDLSEVSEGGNIADAVIPKDHKYRIKVAKSLNEQAPGLLIGAVGLLNDAIQANAILEEQVADAVFSARQFLRNPSFVLSAAHDLGVDIKWINQYECARVKQKYSFF